MMNNIYTAEHSSFTRQCGNRFEAKWQILLQNFAV